MALYNYGDIPEDNFAKEFMLMYRHIFKIFRHVGLEYMESVFPKFRTVQYDVTKARWDNILYTSEKILSGNLSEEEATKTFLYTVAHIMICRSDLQVGSNKLLFGDSIDLSSAIIDDFSHELLFIFNGHLESGVPVDWWIAGLTDDLLERRHMKYGIKLREIPKKAKNITKAAQWLESILRDVRNERTPQFSHSPYTIAMCFSSAMFNFFIEESNYETMGIIYDGLNAKNLFKFKEFPFVYYPLPTIFSTMAYRPRPDFIKLLCGLMTDHKLITNTVEDGAIEWVKQDLPEIYPLVYLSQWIEDGIPIPKISLETTFPTKKKEMIDKNGELIRKFPVGARITLENMNLTEEEAYKGYLFNINHESPLDIQLTPDLKISRGMGIQTKFYT